MVRNAAQTTLGQELEVSFGGGTLGQQPANAQSTDDPWNFWVFRTRFRVELESEEREDETRQWIVVCESHDLSRRAVCFRWGLRPQALRV